MLIYFIRLKKINWKEIIVLSVPLIILAIPLILCQSVQMGFINEIHSFITIPKLKRYRTNEVGLSNILSNIVAIKYALFEDYLNYNSIKGFGTMYYLGTLLMIIGLIASFLDIKGEDRKNLNLNVIFIIYFISNFIVGLLISMNANKMNGIFIAANYFELVCLKKIYKYSKLAFYLIITCLLIYFGMFCVRYFYEDNKYYPFWDNGAIQIFERIEKEYPEKQVVGESVNYTFKEFVKPDNPLDNKLDISGDKFKIGNYTYTRKIVFNEVDTNNIYVTFNFKEALELKEKFDFEMYKEKYCYMLVAEGK